MGVLQTTITAFLNSSNDFKYVKILCPSRDLKKSLQKCSSRLQTIAALVSNWMDGSCGMSQK